MEMGLIERRAAGEQKEKKDNYNKVISLRTQRLFPVSAVS